MMQPPGPALKIGASWAVALAISVLLKAAGHHWPDPPPLRLGWILLALVLPSLGLGSWLLLQPPVDGDRGESSDRAQEPR
jgi:hypothetical protein